VRKNGGGLRGDIKSRCVCQVRPPGC
jgi:hypothetical protein